MTAFAKPTARLLLISSVLVIAACGGRDRDGSVDAPATEARSALGSVVQRATDEARRKLATENISVSHGMYSAGDSHRDERKRDLPDAEISPDGVLLIGGTAVPATPAQTALILDYRTQIVGIAESGMDIGIQGADLAAKAMGEAVKGVFSGKSEADIEHSIEAEADGIERAAKVLCSRLPALLASQQRLAAALPAFAPYATIDESDIDDCMDDHGKDSRDGQRSAKRDQVRDVVRQRVRDTVRSAVRTGSSDRRDAAEEADAAGAEPKPAR